MRYILFLILFFSGFANASTVDYWKLYSGGSYGPGEYSSALSACQSYNTSGSPTYRLVTQSSTTVKCYRTVFGNESYIGDAHKLTRTCPYGNTGTQCNLTCDSPNMIVDGQCQAPPPDACFGKTGQTSSFKQAGNSSDANAFYKPVTGSNYFVHPRYVVSDGCAMYVNGGTRCKVYGNGDYSCVGSATYSGETASAEAENDGPASDECTELDCPDTDPTPTADSSNSCTPWVFGEFGVERNCSSVENSNQPGKGSCMTDGSLVCVKADPVPTSTATSTGTVENKSTDSESGDVTTVKTDTINKTYCSAGACTTSTTTNKSTTINNAAGEQTGKTGECTGPACASSTNPDADGDGLGDCVKDCGEDEEEEGSATVSESCEVPPACDGDPFQCAILVQVHYNSCQERRPLDEEEEQAIEAEITAGETAQEQAQTELDGSLGTFFSGFQAAASGTTAPGSAMCWPDKVISMPFGVTFVMPFSLVCPFLALFRIAMLAIGYLVAARILHTQI